MSSSTSIYLLRTMQQHHVALSTMADTKANIMIGVCVGMLIFGISRVGAAFHPAWLLSLCGTAMLSGLSAIVAVNPSFKARHTQQLLTHSNPLFFGNFVHMPEHKFYDELLEILKTEDSIYAAMMKDVYQLGQVLYFGKYRYLRYSYNSFISGMALTVILAFYHFSSFKFTV